MSYSEEFLKIIKDFLTAKLHPGYDDNEVEEMMVEIKANWETTNTRLEQLLEIGLKQEPTGVQATSSSFSRDRGLAIPNSLNNKREILHLPRSHGRHSRSSHSVSCTPPIHNLTAFSFSNSLAHQQIGSSVPSEKKKPTPRLNKKTDEKIQAWKEKKEKQQNSLGVPNPISVTSRNDNHSNSGPRPTLSFNKTEDNSDTFPEGPGVFWMEGDEALSVSSKSPSISRMSYDESSGKTEQIIVPTKESVVVSKPKNESKFAHEPLIEDDFSGVNIVNNPSEQLEAFNLKIVYQKNHTGFEEARDFPITKNCIIAGRYEITHYLGSAAFSSAVQCIDRKTNKHVCIKVIKNTKDFFDQCLDEVKLLRYIVHKGNPDEHNVLKLYDYFYYKEHLFIVTELLRDNLYEFYKFNRESGGKLYFTLGRLRKVAQQCLEALKFIHEMDIIHCDLKPENILIKSYKKCQIKVIDFGSSCFRHDELSSYVQSRSYRAPEVILGCDFDEKIDLWSLGCILGELFIGSVLFQNSSAATLLARIVATFGNFPMSLLAEAKLKDDFLKQGRLYETTKKGEIVFIKIVPTPLEKVLDCNEPLFLDFLTKLLKLDPKERISAQEALSHPWIHQNYPEEPLDEDIYKDDQYESDDYII